MNVGDGEETMLLDLLAGDQELLSEQIENDCMKGDLETLLEQLPDLQSRVLRMRYGIDGEEPMSLTGIAKHLGMSRDKARRLQRDGLIFLRKSSLQPFEALYLLGTEIHRHKYYLFQQSHENS